MRDRPRHTARQILYVAKVQLSLLEVMKEAIEKSFELPSRTLTSELRHRVMQDLKSYSSITPYAKAVVEVARSHCSEMVAADAPLDELMDPIDDELLLSTIETSLALLRDLANHRPV